MIPLKLFRKRAPVTCEAVQYDGTFRGALALGLPFLPEAMGDASLVKGCIVVETPTGEFVNARQGDWLVRDGDCWEVWDAVEFHRIWEPAPVDDHINNGG